jgi:hypothetical protein
MDISAGPHTQGSKNTIGTSGLKLSSWQWQSTDSTTTNIFNCITNKKMLSAKPHMDQLIRKETEIELHPNSMNKEDGLDLKVAK